MFDTLPLPRRFLTLLDLARQGQVPAAGPSAGDDLTVDSPCNLHAAWGPSVGDDISTDESGAAERNFNEAWGPSVGDDFPDDGASETAERNFNEAWGPAVGDDVGIDDGALEIRIGEAAS